MIPIVVMLGVPAWFLFPPREDPVSSDVVLVMAGASDGRHQVGAQLVEEGTARNFVVSNPDGADDKVGYSHCHGEDRPTLAEGICCMRPEPVDTVGEAVTLAELAETEGWSAVTAVTNRPHTHRVRTVFKRCTDLDVVVVSTENVNVTRLPYHVAREIGGYLKFWLTMPC